MTEGSTLGDSYTVAEAAKVIGRTPKRVRQMITEGKLHPLEGVTPVRIPAEEVHSAREDARKGTRTGPAPGSTGLTLADVMALVDSLTTKALESAQAERLAADAARDKAEQILRDAHAEERALRQAAEAQRDAALNEARALREQLQAEPVAAEPVQRRRWWQRG